MIENYNGGSYCEHCGRAPDEWPTGLVSVDREDGMFGGDFTLCPDCCIEQNFCANGLMYLIRSGVVFAHITWFWWKGNDRG
jgi:hypothetical protein